MKAIIYGIIGCFGLAAAMVAGLLIYLIIAAIIDYIKKEKK